MDLIYNYLVHILKFRIFSEQYATMKVARDMKHAPEVVVDDKLPRPSLGEVDFQLNGLRMHVINDKVIVNINKVSY